jgi:hypothetical protein
MKRSAPLAVLLAIVLAAPYTALAHNEPVHQRMTDYAYHVLLASAHFSDKGPLSDRLHTVLEGIVKSDSTATAFYADASKAVAKLRALKSGLPNDTAPCVSPFLTGLFGGAQPDWMLPAGTALADLPMGQVRLPVSVHYSHGSAICAIDENWVPSGVLASVNPGSFTSRDHTGVTLGFWAAAPDEETKDWVLSSTTLETLQNPAVLAAVAAGTTVLVSVACALACGFFPPACALCPFLAVGAAGKVVDEITSVDAEAIESGDFVGFGHFVDMKPTPASPAFFDAKPAKFMERAGPAGTPDTTEELVMALFEVGGIHVNHDLSEAPKNYEIMLGSGAVGTDFHTNTTHRDKAQWESPTVPHLQLTPVDDLGMFGYLEARKNKGTADEPHRLGWPLHALGDASVPMHAVGASGFGHRPYEDAVDMVYDDLVASNAGVGPSAVMVHDVVVRALKWRKFIQAWRALHGTTEVPVRDLIEAVAATTRTKAMAQPSVFKPDQSLQYITDEDGATAAYDNPTMAAIQRDLLIEGIAAELAFLMSYTEVTP